MNKVRCINGHFFDMDKFGSCPICGGAAGGQVEKVKSRKRVESLRQSRLDEVDKTALLVENDVGATPTEGTAGGIKWHFGKTASSNAESDQPEVEKTNVAQQSAEVHEAQTGPVSSLTQAVAATGHGASSALPKTVAHYSSGDKELPTGWLVCVKGVYHGQTFPCKKGWNRIGRNPNCYINMIDDNSVSREPQAAIIYDPKQKCFYIQEGTSDELAYLNGEPLTSRNQLCAYDRIEMGDTELVFIPLCSEQFTWDDFIS